MYRYQKPEKKSHSPKLFLHLKARAVHVLISFYRDDETETAPPLTEQMRSTSAPSLFKEENALTTTSASRRKSRAAEVNVDTELVNSAIHAAYSDEKIEVAGDRFFKTTELILLVFQAAKTIQRAFRAYQLQRRFALAKRRLVFSISSHKCSNYCVSFSEHPGGRCNFISNYFSRSEIPITMLMMSGKTVCVASYRLLDVFKTNIRDRVTQPYPHCIAASPHRR